MTYPGEAAYDIGWTDANRDAEVTARHRLAVTAPHEYERPMVDMLRGWLEFARGRRELAASGETRAAWWADRDRPAREAWVSIGYNLLVLVESPARGRLDAATLQTIIRETIRAEVKRTRA